MHRFRTDKEFLHNKKKKTKLKYELKCLLLKSEYPNYDLTYENLLIIKDIEEFPIKIAM